MEAREDIRRDSKQEESNSNMFAQIQQMAAASLFLIGKVRLNQSFLKNIEENYDNTVVNEHKSVPKKIRTIKCSLIPVLYLSFILTQLPGTLIN